MYEVVFDGESIKFLNTLPKELRQIIFDKIADIDDNSKKIIITMIGHRKNVYKNIRF
ncbi:MAG: hypothetical protein ABIG30_03135 [Candidatus Aenigmatarchaeota archaeon]